MGKERKTNKYIHTHIQIFMSIYIYTSPLNLYTLKYLVHDYIIFSTIVFSEICTANDFSNGIKFLFNYENLKIEITQ